MNLYISPTSHVDIGKDIQPTNQSNMYDNDTGTSSLFATSYPDAITVGLGLRVAAGTGQYAIIGVEIDYQFGDLGLTTTFTLVNPHSSGNETLGTVASDTSFDRAVARFLYSGAKRYRADEQAKIDVFLTRPASPGLADRLSIYEVHFLAAPRGEVYRPEG